jgi:hypothetical protein
MKFKIKEKMKIADYFVAVDKVQNRICIKHIQSNKSLMKYNLKWKSDYPSFDDLMDNFKEVTDQNLKKSILNEVPKKFKLQA